MEWQPMETAPKDGRIIDVWLGDAEASDVDFYCTPGTRRAAGWKWAGGKWRPATGLHLMPVFVQPTMWMPLPSPPPTRRPEPTP